MSDKKQNRNYLTVVMPAYNEEKHICDNLIYAADVIKSFEPDYSIIAVNDGSTDNTLSEIRRACDKNSRIHLISYDKNAGKGNAIKTGFLAADAEYIAYLDSDMELAPEMLEDYLREMKKQDADIVAGSKMHKASELEYPLIRKILSFGYYVFLRLLFRMKLKDTQTGIKLFKGDKIKVVMSELCTAGFAFDIEILARAAARGYKIIEMPVKLRFTRNKEGKKSNISMRIIIGMVRDAFYIRKRVKADYRHAGRITPQNTKY